MPEAPQNTQHPDDNPYTAPRTESTGRSPYVPAGFGCLAALSSVIACFTTCTVVAVIGNGGPTRIGNRGPTGSFRFLGEQIGAVLCLPAGLVVGIAVWIWMRALTKRKNR